MPKRALLSLVILGLTSLGLNSAARADLVIGRVVDAQGVGVPGVNLDFLPTGGGLPPLVLNDGTGPNGFFATTCPAGIYDVEFITGPASGLLGAMLPGVVIVGTADVGVITLEDGAIVTGRIFSSSQTPLGSVEIEAVDPVTGLSYGASSTDLFGNYNLTLPLNLKLDLQIDPSASLGQVHAPHVQPVKPTGDLVVNSLSLLPGFQVTATFLQPNGLPLVGADTDLVNVVTGQTMFTPNDNTDLTGTVSLTVPAGFYDFDICPDVTTGLVPLEIPGLPVFSNIPGGTLMLQSGFLLSGTIQNAQGQPLVNVDVDLLDVNTGVEIGLCDDNTNAAGQYAIIAPPGAYDVVFSPTFDTPYASVTVPDFNMNTSKTLSAVLPNCPPPQSYGTGHPGWMNRVPVLSASGGSPRLGNEDFTFEISNGRGRAQAFLVIGLEQAATPFHDGTMLVAGPPVPERGDNAMVIGADRPGPAPFTSLGPPMELHEVHLGGFPFVPGSGKLSLPSPIPQDTAWIGMSRFAQILVRDPQASDGWALSNGVKITYCK